MRRTSLWLNKSVTFLFRDDDDPSWSSACFRGIETSIHRWILKSHGWTWLFIHGLSWRFYGQFSFLRIENLDSMHLLFTSSCWIGSVIQRTSSGSPNPKSHSHDYSEFQCRNAGSTTWHSPLVIQHGSQNHHCWSENHL